MKEEKSKNPKALYYIHDTLSDFIFSKIIDSDTTKKASDKLKEEIKEEHKKKGKYLPCHYYEKPIILRKITSSKISDFFIMIIVIKMVILRSKLCRKSKGIYKIFVCRY